MRLFISGGKVYNVTLCSVNDNEGLIISKGLVLRAKSPAEITTLMNMMDEWKFHSFRLGIRCTLAGC